MKDDVQYSSGFDGTPNFVIAVSGQSNSQGYGGYYDATNPEDQAHDRILSWNAARLDVTEHVNVEMKKQSGRKQL